MKMHRYNKSATIIKKFMKGNKIAKGYESVYIKLRLENNFDYFDEIRHKIETDLQIKLVYHWKKYQKMKIRRKKIENDKKLL